ncbi:ABC transporter substrate-binding protein [Virgibacillus sp. DJP39]|uniref:ABC transporter substrate-binding protein n=1 Tax=Virgibacillus sp. DJP39 TaxID=3409790 RepID=UPI003BB76B15
MIQEPFASTWLKTDEDRTPYVVLDANPHYWNKTRGPRLDRVVFRNELTPDLALHLCTTTEGQVDIVTQVPPKHAKMVSSSAYAKLVNVNSNRILAGTFNRFKRDVSFDDKNIRLALNLAIQREKIIQEGFYGFASHVPAMTPPWAFDYPEELSSRQYDAYRARELFQASHWPEGRRMKITSTVEFAQAAYLIAADIENTLPIGVDVSIIPRHEEIKWKRIVAEKKLVPAWDIMLASTTALFLEGTPAFFHRKFFGSDGELRVGPELPAFNQLFKKMVAQTDQTNLLEVAKEIDRYVYEEALALFLCSPQDLYAVNRNVIFRPYRTTFELADTEVNEFHWSRR